MPRSSRTVCLVIALCGPWLVQAEAAGDLARLLAQATDPACLAACDEGVGDDPVVAASSQMGAAAEPAQVATACLDALADTRSVPRLRAADRLADRTAPLWPSSPRIARHIWLQLFLI